MSEKTEDIGEAAFRLANRRFRPLSHLTADFQVYEMQTRAWKPRLWALAP